MSEFKVGDIVSSSTHEYEVMKINGHGFIVCIKDLRTGKQIISNHGWPNKIFTFIKPKKKRVLL